MGLYLYACNDVSLHVCVCSSFAFPNHTKKHTLFFTLYRNTFEDVVIKDLYMEMVVFPFYYVKIETGYLHSETCLDGPAHTLTQIYFASILTVWCVRVCVFGFFSDFGKLLK